MRFRNAAAVVIGFAIAMAYLESAVVVYLQRALAITPDQLFPLRGADVVGSLAGIEVGREFATLVMLVAIGCLAGRSWIDRLAWTAVAFGVWDILYYVWLWVFIGWPSSPLNWDILFLIPVPWAGPVWAPVIVSSALIAFGLVAAYRTAMGRAPSVSRREVSIALIGGLLVVLSFTVQAPGLMKGDLPSGYPWPIFAAGMAAASWAAFASVRRGAVSPPPNDHPERLSQANTRALADS